jgi:hypothetical protein
MPLRPLALAAVVGSALTLAVVGLMSMTQVLPAGQHVIVSYGPEPRDMLRIPGGAPYVVPDGKILVVTAVTTLSPGSGDYPSEILIDGQVAYLLPPQGNPAFLWGVPSGLTVPGGSSIQLGAVGDSLAAYWRIWGYLATA